MTVTEPRHVTITVVELRPTADACTADDSPYVAIIEVPDGLDSARPATAVLDRAENGAEDTAVRLRALD